MMTELKDWLNSINLTKKNLIDEDPSLEKEYNPYIRGLSVWVGFKQTYIDYIRDARLEGESKFSLLAEGPVTQFIRGVTSYSLKPLYIGVIFGLELILSNYVLSFTFMKGLNDRPL